MYFKYKLSLQKCFYIILLLFFMFRIVSVLCFFYSALYAFLCFCEYMFSFRSTYVGHQTLTSILLHTVWFYVFVTILKCVKIYKYAIVKLIIISNIIADIIAFANSAADAMENWGLIIYKYCVVCFLDINS